MSSPTFLTRSLEWFVTELDALVKERTSFEINSFVRVFNPLDAFNQEFFKDQKVNYPFISYQTKNSSLAMGRLGSMTTRKKGFAFSSVTLSNSQSKDNSIDYVVDVTGQRIKQGAVWPIDVEIAISFFTNTPQQFEEFLLAWFELHPSISKKLPFDDKIDLPAIIIPTVESIDYPDQESDDRGEFYRGELTAQLQTFSGTVGDIAAVKNLSASEIPTNNQNPLQIDVLTDKNGNAVGNIIKISPLKP